MSEGKTVVVTGASRGLGRNIALSAKEAGYKVIGLARKPEDNELFEIRACDVADEAQVKVAFDALRNEAGLYALINAAGVASMNIAMATPTATMRRIVEINLLGTMYCCAAMGRLLARHKTGRIINFSTIAVPLGLKGETSYVASKAGVEGFTRAFAREMADFDVTVNVIAPGPIWTDMIKNVPQNQIAEIVGAQIVPRMAVPDDVCDVVSLILSDKARMLSGQVFSLGGV